MDFDAKIQWKPGMAMTASVLKHRDEDLEERMRAFRKTLLGNGRVGLLPDFEYYAWGAFSGKVYELMGLKLSALLPSGRLIHIYEDLKIEIPSLADGVYFLTLGVSDRIHEFEMDDIPYSRPEYELSVRKRDEIDGQELVPIKRFIVEEGILNVDEDYIPPVLTVYQNDAFKKYMNGYADALSGLIGHQNMEEGDCKFTFLRYMFHLKAFNDRCFVVEMVQFLYEVAQAVDYFIVDGLGKLVDQIPQEVLALKDDERRHPFLFDINTFLKWLDEYLKSLTLLMDKVVIPDDAIDYSQLKKEITDELSEKLRADLSASIYEELHSKLTPELTESVCETIRRLIEDKLSPELKDLLRGELHGALYPELYDSLYAELSKLSYKPAEVEEDTFSPII